MNGSVCLGEHLVTDAQGNLQLAPWSVPRNVVDVKAQSGNDTTKLLITDTLPGRLLIDRMVDYTNDTPIEQDIRVMVTRRWRRWVTSSPNAVQFRDRWSSAITTADALEPVIPVEPTVASLFNGQVGSAGDMQSNTVAEPNPGLFHHWWGTGVAEEWLGPLKPGSTIRVWYRQFCWTPPPFSDNANKNAPRHEAEAGWARIQLQTFPRAGRLVTG
ncbi:hypothetical protein KAYACHO_30 [Mycobacterium phage KayaCho]|uniref:hypothetical protein n=1 Tax=Mycobacterium phage KayaCho TaxID=1340830 RepID=UPI000388124E|nr:hypothetical protein N846_gp30 [Mycobacterium phage KayaCho]AGT12934.1 hypothetical protein KAYACHO_30 [Mycobacterium phage KayaCho]